MDRLFPLASQRFPDGVEVKEGRGRGTIKYVVDNTAEISKVSQKSQIVEKKEDALRANQFPDKLSNLDITEPTRYFIGREQELMQVINHLKSNSNRKRIAIYGMGGVGKTQLLRKVASTKSIQKKYDSRIVFFHSETEDSQQSSFRLLAKVLHTNVSGLKFKLANSEHCLFLFDNLQDIEKYNKINDFLGLGQSIHDVIITSQSAIWPGFEPIPLKIFSSKESVRYVKFVGSELLARTISEEDASTLSNLLGRLPLGLSTIMHSLGKTPIELFIKEFQEEENTRKEYLEKRLYLEDTYYFNVIKDENFNETYNIRTVFNTWQYSIKSLSKIARKYLYMFSFIDAEKIPIFLLKNSTSSPSKLLDQLLNRGGLIEIEENQQTFAIHRLVQEVIRIDLAIKKKSFNYIIDCLSLLNEAFSYKHNQTEGVGRCAELFIHANRILEYSKKILNISEFKNRIYKLFIDLNVKIGLFGLYNFRNFHKALEQLLYSEELLNYEISHRKGEVINAISYIYLEFNQLDNCLVYNNKAENLYMTIKKFDENCTFEDKHYGLGFAIRMKGYIANKLHNYTQAEGNFKKALQYFHEAKFRKNHIQVFLANQGLVTTLRLRGKFEEAEKIIKEVIENFKKVYGDDHTNTLIANAHLARIYAARGDNFHQEAISLFQLIIRLSSKGFQSEVNPSVAGYYYELAEVYLLINQLDKAEEAYKKAISLYNLFPNVDDYLFEKKLINVGLIKIFILKNQFLEKVFDEKIQDIEKSIIYLKQHHPERKLEIIKISLICVDCKFILYKNSPLRAELWADCKNSYLCLEKEIKKLYGTEDHYFLSIIYLNMSRLHDKFFPNTIKAMDAVNIKNQYLKNSKGIFNKFNPNHLLLKNAEEATANFFTQNFGKRCIFWSVAGTGIAVMGGIGYYAVGYFANNTDDSAFTV